MKTPALILATLLCAVIPAHSAELNKPPVPYSDVGACPFECCTYRQWETTDLVHLYAKAEKGAKKIAEVSKGAKVDGLTGVVITSKPGITKVTKKLEFGDSPKITVMPGDILYTLHYAGEGYDTFWFKGKVLSDQISGDVTEKPDPELSVHIISKPVEVWWVKVRAPNGKIGWTDETTSFAHMDACE